MLLLGAVKSYLGQRPLVLIDEYYWKQRARADWLKGGDKNSAYFHTRASRRKSQNSIHGVVDENGRWVTSEPEVRGVFERYFHNIFLSNGASDADFKLITESDMSSLPETFRASMEESFTGEDVEKALFAMGPRKAPGPDCFHALFFQKS